MDPTILTLIGREFGYPDCCITFFGGEWLTGKILRQDWVEPYEERLEKTSWAHSGYIPCPACLQRKEIGLPTELKREPAPNVYELESTGEFMVALALACDQLENDRDQLPGGVKGG